MAHLSDHIQEGGKLRKSQMPACLILQKGENSLNSSISHCPTTQDARKISARCRPGDYKAETSCEVHAAPPAGPLGSSPGGPAHLPHSGRSRANGAAWYRVGQIQAPSPATSGLCALGPNPSVPSSTGNTASCPNLRIVQHQE